MSPLAFIDSLNSKKHLLLVYVEPKFAKTIQFRFINNGLMKGEHGIYLTHEKTKFVEEEMEEFGINVDQFKIRKLLHIYQVPNPLEHPNSILDGADAILKKAVSDAAPPYRIVARMIPNIQTEEAMAIQDYFEQRFHNVMFKNFNGSVLCSYDFSEIQFHNRWREWLNRLYDSHNASIIQDRNGQQSVINFNNGH